MKQLIIILVILFGIGQQLYAQNKILDRLSFSVGGGAAIPVGTFGMKDIHNSAVHYKEGQYDFIIGIDKSKSGFARLGYDYHAQLSYRLTNHLYVFLRAGQTTNSVEMSGISAFFTQKLEPIEFEEADYTIGSLTPGFGYKLSLKQWDLSIGLFGGRARTNFPVYKGTFTPNLGGFPPSTWAYEGETPDLNSFSTGGTLSVNRHIKRISAGIEIAYQHASFKYDIRFRRIPGYDATPIVHDKLVVSLLNVGLKVAYNLEK
ncbi:MAG: hypothetical protein C0397_15210 [Odoribacter sp.]|nr:hypothetical protein [Odoribacter sp.]